MAKEVKAWQSSDGDIYKTQKLAEAKDAQLIMEAQYQNDQLLGNVEGSYVELPDLLEFVDHYWEELKTILQKD